MLYSSRFCGLKRQELCLVEVDLVSKNRKALACLLDQVVIVVKTTCHGRFMFCSWGSKYSDKEKYATSGKWEL